MNFNPFHSSSKNLLTILGLEYVKILIASRVAARAGKNLFGLVNRIGIFRFGAVWLHNTH